MTAEYNPGHALGLAFQHHSRYVQCMPEHDKVRENRLRRAADRQGLILEKSRRRDPRSVGFGTFRLVDARTNGIVASGTDDDYGLDLDAVEEHLLGAPEQRPPEP